MSGNVWEWCFDLGGASTRRMRGASWIGNAAGAAVAARFYTIYPNRRYYSDIGFRLARNP